MNDRCRAQRGKFPHSFVFTVYLLFGNDVLVKVNTVGGFTSTSFSLSDAVAVSVLPAELIGFISFGLTGIVLNAPPANVHTK